MKLTLHPTESPDLDRLRFLSGTLLFDLIHIGTDLAATIDLDPEVTMGGLRGILNETGYSHATTHPCRRCGGSGRVDLMAGPGDAPCGECRTT